MNTELTEKDSKVPVVSRANKLILEKVYLKQPRAGVTDAIQVIVTIKRDGTSIRRCDVEFPNDILPDIGVVSEPAIDITDAVIVLCRLSSGAGMLIYDIQ